MNMQKGVLNFSGGDGMNRFIEKLEADKQQKVRHEIEKLKRQYKEAMNNFNDTGYGRYQNKMGRIEQEISELQAYQNKGHAVSKGLEEIMVYKSELENMKKELITKTDYLLASIPECSEAVSFREYLLNLKL